MAKTAQAFIDEYNGKVDDFDGAFRAQCVDGYKRFCWWLGVPVLSTRTGWADGYWQYRNDMSDHVKFITDPSKLKKGDWLFWARGSSCPSSHVAMFVGYAGNGYAYCFGQNQGGNGGYTTVKLKLDILGAFRFNALQDEAPAWKKDGTGWWYRFPDGTYPVNKWLMIAGKWYRFDERGYMKTGWFNENGKWYWFGASGAMYENQWLNYNSKWYYLGSDGAMLVGSHTVQAHFNADGALDG
jgi:glucan-binding YG repeat protein